MKVYLVGGAVRDRLLNYPHEEKDWVVVGATPEEMLKLGFRPVGKDFPVFLHPETHEEYALARTERKTGKGYTQFAFHTSKEVTLEEDLRRRDLTINAMAMTESGEVIDPYGGQDDLRLRILRHVSLAFIEDPVRILRVARFMARFHHLGFKIAKETEELMVEMVKAGEVDALVSDRVWAEFHRALSEKNPECFFMVLNQCKALTILFPEFVSYMSQLRISKNNNSEIRFVTLTLILKQEEIISLCKRYPVPVNFRELASISNEIQSFFTQKKSSPELLLELLEKMDAFRREERFNQILIIFKGSPLSAYLKNAYNATKAVSAEDFMKKGFSGKALGEEIRKKRLEIITKLD